MAEGPVIVLAQRMGQVGAEVVGRKVGEHQRPKGLAGKVGVPGKRAGFAHFQRRTAP